MASVLVRESSAPVVMTAAGRREVQRNLAVILPHELIPLLFAGLSEAAVSEMVG